VQVRQSTSNELFKGCLFESLHLGKKVVAVLNESLLGQHRSMLVNELSKLNYVIKTNVKEIKQLFEGELP
jgi:UDP-N-acetylglucosamine transferase subunit ALG13